MTSAQLSQNPYGRGRPRGRERGRKNKEGGTKQAFTLSLIAHLGLLAFLVIGINWNNTPAGIEVELWEPAPQVEEVKTIEPKSEAKVEEATEADIAIKKRKLEKEVVKEVSKPITPPLLQAKETPKEKPRKEEVKEVPKIVKPPPPQEQAKKEPPKKVEPLKKEVVKEASKPAAATPAQIKANAEAEKRREANIASLRGMAAKDGGTGGSVGSGVGSGGNAPPGWSDKVIKKVRGNVTFNADSFKGNKQTIIQVKLAPDGAILSRTMTSSSGDNAWDQAVLSAIDATQSLPKDDDGKLPTLTPELKLKPK